MKKYLSLLLIVTMLAGVFYAVFPAGAAGAQSTSEAGQIATWNSPALCTDAGSTIVLNECSVQFAAKGEIVAGSDITWEYNGRPMSRFIPETAGVYEMTATYGDRTRTVYIVAKNASDSEYILYSDDFSEDPTAGLRTVQQTAGTSVNYDADGKTLVLNASEASDGYVRVLLPGWLDAFGDAVYTASVRITAPKSASRWASLMFRVQNNNYPYMQLAMRYDTTLSNGIEIAERTEADAWNVVEKCAVTPSLADSFNTVSAYICGSTVSYSVNDSKKLSYGTAPYGPGGFGFQVRGVTLTVDWVKIAINTDSQPTENLAEGYADTSASTSKISSAPDIIAETGDISSYKKTDCAAVTVTDIKTAGLKEAVMAGEMPEGSDLSWLGKDSVPGFRIVSDESTQNILKDIRPYLIALNLKEQYIVSSSEEVLSGLRTEIDRYYSGLLAENEFYNGLYLVFDPGEGRYSDIAALRQAAAKCGARTVIIPESLATRENVAYLQDRYLCVWERTDGSDEAVVAAANRGVMGIITPEPERAKECLDRYYPERTLTRYSNIIGHRGVPSLAQENSLAGAVLAFEKGACMVENDIYLAADGVIVVMHDGTIDRTTNGSGSITGLTSEKLKDYQIDVNTQVSAEPIPTLEDYFREFAGTGRVIVIEYKQNSTALAKPLAELIKKYDMTEYTVVISFHAQMLTELRKYIPEVSTGLLDSASAVSDTDALENAVQIIPKVQQYSTSFSPSYQSGALGEKLTQDLQTRGITTWIWTVNSQADFDRYFCMGIRGITTNYSQWVSRYVKTLTAKYEDGRVTVSGLRYNGTESDLTKYAAMSVVSDGGTGITFDPATGELHGKGGSASVFFTYTCATASGTYYNTVTELMTVTFEGTSETETAAQTEAETQIPETEYTETASGTEADAETAIQETEVPAVKKGCSSSCVSYAAALCIISILSVGTGRGIRKKE